MRARTFRRVPRELLEEMSSLLGTAERNEMALPSYLHPNVAMRWMAWRRVEVVAKHMELLRDRYGSFRAVMDFGCGAGVLLEQAEATAERVYAVDLVLEPARRLISARALRNTRLLTSEEAVEEILPGTLDAIVAAEVLEHLDDKLIDTLDWFRTLLRDKGYLLVSLPTESLLYRTGRRLAGFSGHYHHDTAVTLHRHILDAGFREVLLEHVPLPGPLAIYWVGLYMAPERPSS